VVAREGRALWLDIRGRTLRFDEPDPLDPRDAGASDGAVRSPVSGLVRSLTASVGQRVRAGDTLAVVEAMKMETSLTAPCDGVVSVVRARLGEQVQGGHVVFELEREVQD